MMFLFYFIFSRNSPPHAASGRALAVLGRALAAYLARERVTSGRLLRVSEPRCPPLHPGVRTPHGQDSWLRADVRAGRPESQLMSQRKGLHPLPAPPVGRLPGSHLLRTGRQEAPWPHPGPPKALCSPRMCLGAAPTHLQLRLSTGPRIPQTSGPLHSLFLSRLHLLPGWSSGSHPSPQQSSEVTCWGAGEGLPAPPALNNSPPARAQRGCS